MKENILKFAIEPARIWSLEGHVVSETETQNNKYNRWSRAQNLSVDTMDQG